MISNRLLVFAKAILLLLLKRNCGALLSDDLGGPGITIFKNRASLRNNYL